MKQTYLLANPLPTILALYRPLDNIVIRSPPVYSRDAIQHEAQPDEIEDLVEEGTTCQTNRI